MSSGEFGHISEFYQTLLLICIFVMVSFEILSFIFNFNVDDRYLKLLVNDHTSYQQWLTHKSQSTQTTQQNNPQQQQQNDLQKSVANYVQNQITNMQQTHQQPQTNSNQQQSPIPPSMHPPQQQQQQLSQNKRKFFSIYVAYINFMNEKLAILVPLLIVGILTASTYVYTLVAFFCSFLCDLLVEVLEAQEKAHHVDNSGKFGLKQGIKLLGNGFILSIFISYWAVTQFSPS